ncbi:unnamed protein product, partial [Schistocephalus solidus]|uniref:F5/8 type C domain-containing protein n=1 Tax=Schistocephalus solidus TaxID=70667 RepID=A0A183SYP8_SCHSO
PPSVASLESSSYSKLRGFFVSPSRRSYSYYVEVALSKEGTWHRVVDYSNYACRSWQTLYFPARVIRLIRIIPRNNVATVQLGATVLEGVSRLRNSLIDGDVLVYNLNYGFTCHQLGNGCIAVQLSQPFLVSSMRFLLWDLDSRAYSYTVEVSLDRQVWRMVFDASMMHCRSWQTIKFPLQPVTFIRVTGTGNTANNVSSNSTPPPSPSSSYSLSCRRFFVSLNIKLIIIQPNPEIFQTRQNTGF